MSYLEILRDVKAVVAAYKSAAADGKITTEEMVAIAKVVCESLLDVLGSTTGSAKPESPAPTAVG
jgi:uncharacterized membrane protein YebE (DUF533 family)